MAAADLGDKMTGELAGVKDAFVNLVGVIDFSKVSVLNGTDSSNLKGVLQGSAGAAVKSDADEQLLIFVPFQDIVKIKAICFAGGDAKNGGAGGPAKVKVFVGGANLDFDGAQAAVATQAFALTAAQLDGRELPTTFVKFQNVRQLTIFIETNQKNTPASVLNRLTFIGSAKAGFDMNNLKKTGCDWLRPNHSFWAVMKRISIKPYG